MFLDFRATLEELLWPLNLKDPLFIGTPCIYYRLYLGHQPQKRGTAVTAGFSCHFHHYVIASLVYNKYIFACYELISTTTFIHV